MKATYTPDQVAALFGEYPEQWWIAGGWAIDLFLGQQTREHEDVDVAILRDDERNFRAHLDSWELWPGLGNSQLEARPITLDKTLPTEREVLWCRPNATTNWAFELLLNKTTGEDWVFKRNENIYRPLEQLGSITEDGIPYLNPEIVLLFKAKNLYDKDRHDFEQARPQLRPDARDWLREALHIAHPGHTWLADL